MDHERIFPRFGQSSNPHSHYHANSVAYTNLHSQPDCHANADQDAPVDFNPFKDGYIAPQ